MDSLNEKFPGLRIALDQRKQFYAKQGKEVPIMEGMDTRRLIYGIADLRLGIVRAGAHWKSQPRPI